MWIVSFSWFILILSSSVPNNNTKLDLIKTLVMNKAVILVLLSNVYTLFVTSPNLNLFKKLFVIAQIWLSII